jgi:hypothetical protein
VGADDTWSDIGPGQITGWGMQPDGGSGGVGSGVTSTVVTAAGGTPPWYSPDNPLFWFGGLLLLVTGAIVTSTSVDVGKLRVKEKS